MDSLYDGLAGALVCFDCLSLLQLSLVIQSVPFTFGKSSWNIFLMFQWFPMGNARGFPGAAEL